MYKKEKDNLEMYNFGNEICSPNYSFGPAIKENYKIYMITKGKGELKHKNKTYYLGEGEAFLICPQEIVYYKADSIEPWSYYWIAFGGSKVKLYLDKTGISSNKPVFKYNYNNLLKECMENILRVSKADSSYFLKYKSLIYSFMSIIIDLHENEQHIKNISMQKEHYVNNIIQYINHKYNSKILISDLANQIGLDRKYLATIFKQVKGISPREYLINYRMEKACELLKNTNLSIADISRSVGYEDPLLFSKMFSKTYGHSPKYYKNKEQTM